MPAMTVANQIAYVKRLARNSSNFLTEGLTTNDEAARHYVNVGAEEFAKKAKLSKENYVTVTPQFDLRDNWYSQITITDGDDALPATNVAVSDAEYNDIGGGSVASILGSQINAAITAAAGSASAVVTWSDSSWVFTITPKTGFSAVEIAGPSYDTYIDANEKLFSKTGTQTSAWVGSFPQDSTLQVDLPSDFYSMEYVDYDGFRLYEAPFNLFMSPENTSYRPQYYAIRDRTMFISYPPSTRKMCKIRYKYLPTPVTLTGDSDGTTCALQSEDHMAPVYYAAGMVLKETFDFEESDRNMGMFLDQVMQRKMKEHNQNPKLVPIEVDYFIPRVNIDEV